ncbi:ABC transporter ATP-binding protein [Calidithermus chliarophilus]|uniref:ABC transporter ATP-binding protein n=1 Tax=Calidithermus chliarophilus TaxID=52023 RepID=UPI000423E97C|nr:ABC transporter ATP-binding protein [Calidithermus chliarophilus]
MDRPPRLNRALDEATPPPRPRVLLADLRATLRLVWASSPPQTLLIAAISVLQAFIPAASLWVSKLLIDDVALAVQGRLPGGFGTLVGLLGLQVGLGVAGTLLATLHNAARDLLGDTLQNRIHRRILEKAAGLELAHFENPKTYDALLGATYEVGSRPLGVFTQLVALAQAVLTLSSIGFLMSRLGWAVMPLVLLASLPGVLVASRFGFENYRMIRRRAPEARMQNYLAQVLVDDDYVKEVRIFGFEGYVLGRWQEVYRKFRAQLVPLVYQRGAWGFAASLASAILIALATLQVLARAAAGRISVGDFALFAQGIVQVQGTFSNLLGGLSGIYQNLLYMRNLFEFLELPARSLDTGEEWKGPIHSVEFQDVSFRYPLTEREVLKGVSFRLERGQSMALVGENGAGKTTVVKLLTRLYEPTSGRILLNGQDARRYSPRSVQKEISSIFQDYARYALTARENVALSHIEQQGNRAGLEQASRKGGADEVIAALPEGYDTQLGRQFNRGLQLSGGQWQRLALSRLYFRDSSVLVFDEPTAALDAAAEFEVIEALRQQAKDRITLIISHRFSTVRLADVIVVLEDGRVSEQGSHEELLRQGGTYATLFRLQARGYQEQAESQGKL